MRLFLFIATVLAAAFLAGCGGESAGDSGSGSTQPPIAGIGAGPGISIEQAIASNLDGPLLVSGNVLAEGDEIHFCSALAESFPPQCGGPSLRVEGLKLEEVDGLVTEGDVSWTDRPIQLLGIVEDGVLSVSQNATA
jgi:hypothetical protein